VIRIRLEAEGNNLDSDRVRTPLMIIANGDVAGVADSDTNVVLGARWQINRNHTVRPPLEILSG